MSPPKGFTRFMVETELASNPKIGRLTDAQRWVLVGGVWALAAKANPRGYLIVGGHPATELDVAHQARCTVALARKTLTVLRSLEMIETDGELGVEFVHDWWETNPDPKPDPTNAERQARFKAKRKAAMAASNGPGNGGGNAPGNGKVTPTEVEGEVEALLLASSRSKVVRLHERSAS